jgi:hypothetical protein
MNEQWNPQYERMDGKLIFKHHERDVGLVSIEEFAIGYCYDQTLQKNVLLKHGTNESVQKWMSETGTRFREAGQIKDFEFYKVIHSPADAWDLEKINKSLQNPEFFDAWINDLNAQALKELSEKNAN